MSMRGSSFGTIFLSTPSVRRATITVCYPAWTWVFLSTPSVRRATCGQNQRYASSHNFYPRPP